MAANPKGGGLSLRGKGRGRHLPPSEADQGCWSHSEAPRAASAPRQAASDGWCRTEPDAARGAPEELRGKASEVRLSKGRSVETALSQPDAAETGYGMPTRRARPDAPARRLKNLPSPRMRPSDQPDEKHKQTSEIQQTMGGERAAVRGQKPPAGVVRPRTKATKTVSLRGRRDVRAKASASRFQGGQGHEGGLRAGLGWAARIVLFQHLEDALRHRIRLDEIFIGLRQHGLGG